MTCDGEVSITFTEPCLIWHRGVGQRRSNEIGVRTLHVCINCIIVGGILVLPEITTQRQTVASALNC